MARTNVYIYPNIDDDFGAWAESEGRPVLAGHFDLDKAERFKEDTEWDGSNHRSLATGIWYRHEALYRTAGGRWVKNWWSQWQGETETWTFVTDKDAEQWLLLNGHDEAVERFFGEIPEEVGPGRPEIGPPVNVRLGEHLTGVDAYAKEFGISRAEAVRRLVAAGLADQATAQRDR